MLPTRPPIATQLYQFGSSPSTAPVIADTAARLPPASKFGASPTQSDSALSSPISTQASRRRHLLNRRISPDLPTNDALYLFMNFASYMHSPKEKGEGIGSNEEFEDTIRLLDFSRQCAADPRSNVHILHLKYDFPHPPAVYDRPPAYRYARIPYPTPQAFSPVDDPVIKVKFVPELGVFNPLPAQAVFGHIAKVCQPPPRIIVVSYVSSKVTENHLASISRWAITGSPPSYVFSPAETRIRERLPLHLALHHAIPVSMYASDGETCFSPASSASRSPILYVPDDRTASPSIIPTSVASDRQFQAQDTADQSLNANAEQLLFPVSPQRPHGCSPIASLTIYPAHELDELRSASPGMGRARISQSLTAATPVDSHRIPLWKLAHGVDALRLATSIAVGVSLQDLGAVKLFSRSSPSNDTTSRLKATVNSEEIDVINAVKQARMAPHDDKSTIDPQNCETQTRLPHDRSDISFLRKGPANNPVGVSKPIQMISPASPTVNPQQIYVTPPDKAHNSNHLSPPDQHLDRLSLPKHQTRRSSNDHEASSEVEQPSLSLVRMIYGWKSGRKEQMNNIIDTDSLVTACDPPWEAAMDRRDLVSLI